LTAIPGTYKPFTAEQRFWMKVNKSGDIPASAPELGNCWIWTGKLHDYGYGLFSMKSKHLRAHRVSWEMHHGEPIPDGLIIRHLCDVRACVRPEHLSVGDYSDNTADAVARQRNAVLRGEANPGSKMTRDTVQWAREQWAAGAATKAELARRCGVTQTTMSAVLERRSWKHVS
jgi:HNH endonuclease